MNDTTVYIEAVDSVGTIILPTESSTVIIGNTTIVIDADPDVVFVESPAPESPVVIVAPDQINVTIADDPISVTIANPEITIIDSGIPGEGGASEADEVHYDNANYENVQEALDVLLYVTPHINSFTNNVGTVETGTIITAITLSWATNKVMTTLSLDHGIGSVLGLTSKALTGLSLTSDITYILTAQDGQNTTSATTTIQYRNKRYWGVSASESLDNAGVLGLSGNEFATNFSKQISYDATGGKYLYYCYPSAWGIPNNVTAGGLAFTDYSVTTLEFANQSAHTETYNVLRVRNLQTGASINLNWA